MNEELLIEKVVNIEKDVEHIKEKILKIDMLDDILAGQDKMITILQRLDQEHVFTSQRIKRLELQVERIKVHLHLV